MNGKGVGEIVIASLPGKLGCIAPHGGTAAAGVLLAIAFLVGAQAPPPVRESLPAASQVAAEEVSVTIDNFTFAPSIITVAAGTRVVWVNDDDIPHTVVAEGAGAGLRSPPLDTGDRYAFTFTTPGSYAYFCSLHPHMRGTIVVR